jgi:hypothetical protein
MLASNVESQPWRWTARALAPGVSAEEGRKVKCDVRLLDTVFFSPSGADDATEGAGGGLNTAESTWLFTSKHGTVALKKQEQVAEAKIVERFTRFAMMNPLNVDEIVGKALSPGGEERNLRSDDLERLLQSNGGGGTSEAVQVYLRPRDGADETFVAEYTVDEQLRGIENHAGTVRLKRRVGGNSRGQPEETLPSTWDPAARSDMEAAVRAMVRHIEATQNESRATDSGSRLTVPHMRAEFILDDNHQAWLTHVPTLHSRRQAMQAPWQWQQQQQQQQS